MTRPLRTQVFIACGMIQIARAVLSFVRSLSALACMGFALIEILRLVGPANVPDVGRYTFLALASVALAVSAAAHVMEVILSRRTRLSRLNRRAIELGAAARPKVVDLDLYRRLAARNDRRLWGRRGAHPE